MHSMTVHMWSIISVIIHMTAPDFSFIWQKEDGMCSFKWHTSVLPVHTLSPGQRQHGDGLTMFSSEHWCICISKGASASNANHEPHVKPIIFVWNRTWKTLQIATFMIPLSEYLFINKHCNYSYKPFTSFLGSLVFKCQDKPYSLIAMHFRAAWMATLPISEASVFQYIFFSLCSFALLFIHALNINMHLCRCFGKLHDQYNVQACCN